VVNRRREVPWRGDAAIALAWLVNTRGARYEHLSAGSGMLSGVLTASVALRSGAKLVGELDGLGSAELHS
jgi:2-keto-4-pentenoate hydratase